MPEYDYQCKSCHRAFTIQASMREKRNAVICTACGGAEVVRVFAGISVQRGAAFPAPGLGSESLSASPSCHRCGNHNPCGAG